MWMFCVIALNNLTPKYITSKYQLAVYTSTQQDQVQMVISKQANSLQTMVNQHSGTKGLQHGM